MSEFKNLVKSARLSFSDVTITTSTRSVHLFSSYTKLNHVFPDHNSQLKNFQLPTLPPQRKIGRDFLAPPFFALATKKRHGETPFGHP